MTIVFASFMLSSEDKKNHMTPLHFFNWITSLMELTLMKFKRFSLVGAKRGSQSSVDRGSLSQMKFARFFVNYSHDCRGPRRGMKYHPIWITSAETFVRCYQRSLIPPNYKSRCSSVGRYLPLTFSLLLLLASRPSVSVLVSRWRRQCCWR